MARLLSRACEKPHPWFTRLQMRRHLGVCVWCGRYQEQVGLIGKLCRMFAEESCGHGAEHLPDEARARMKAALEHHG
jgi:hypothetical protein